MSQMELEHIGVLSALVASQTRCTVIVLYCICILSAAKHSYTTKKTMKNTDRHAEGLPGQDGTNGNPD